MRSPKKPTIFYGYWVLVAAFFCLFIQNGAGLYCFSLFVKPLEADFGWGRGETMAALTILFVMIGVFSPLVGRIVDRYGVREVIAIGALVSGLGFVMLSLTNSLWSFYLGYVITGAGMTAIGSVPTSAAVLNWFEKRRGTAIGIMSTGIGTGGFAMTTLVGGYLIPNFGWRTSYFVMAVITWVLIIPLALFVIKTRPTDTGLYSDSTEDPEPVVANKVPSSAVNGSTLRMALATPALWLMGTAFLLNLFGSAGVVHNGVPYLEDIGFPIAIAATALGTVALSSAIGKLGFGWLCDRIPVKYAYSIGISLQLVGIIIFINVGPVSPPALLWLYAITIGLGGGAWLPSGSMLTSTTFGLASYGAIFGMVSLFQNVGTALGPLAAGYMYDIMNTYHWVFIIFAVLCALSIPTILAVRRPKRP